MSIILQREIHWLVVVGIASTHQLCCIAGTKPQFCFTSGAKKNPRKDENKTHESYLKSFDSCGLCTDKAQRIEANGGRVAAWRGGGSRRSITRAEDASRQLVLLTLDIKNADGSRRGKHLFRGAHSC